jgi:hypothetical protein
MQKLLACRLLSVPIATALVKNIATCDLSDTSQKRESAESVSQLICYGRKKIVFNMHQCCGFEIKGDDLFLAQAAIYEDSQKMWISLPTDLLCNLDPCSVLLVKIESSNNFRVGTMIK